MDNLVCNAVAPWKGYLHWLGNVREGTSKAGNEYGFADFTLKYTDHKMQEKFITFSTGSVETVKLLKSVPIGTPLKVAWLPDSKEDAQRNRWYPSYSAYNVSAIRDEGPQKVQQQSAPAQGQRASYPQPQPPLPQSDTNYQPDEGDLPF